MTIQEIAGGYVSAGLSVLPIRSDGSKAPDVAEWKVYQNRLPDTVELSQFRTTAGLAIICGSVSGNLEVVDFDDAQHFAEWSALVEECLGAEFFARLCVVKTPRPGFHVYTRCETIAGNSKLAQVRLSADGGRGGVKTLIETRGEGGYVLAPGCPTTCHETGRTYDVVQGALSSIPRISTAEREALFSCARSFNKIWREAEDVHPALSAAGAPGSDYCARSTWADVLKPHGFRSLGVRGNSELWTRPGKERGVSASTNYGGSDLFYSFSTNCYPFDSERGYNKFSAYALLNHDGNFHLAAKTLAHEGYGTPKVAAVKSVPHVSDILAVSDLRARVLGLYERGLQPGVSPGWESLRELWTVRRGDWSVVTGTPGHGKSSVIDNVMLNTARESGWNWAVWSAENLPQELHVSNLVSIYSARPFTAGPNVRVSMSELLRAMDFIEDHFRFISPPEDNETLAHVLADVEIVMQDRETQGVLIDPWNELTHTYPNTETEYISNSLKSVRRFVARTNSHVIIVAHPTKLRKQPDGSYPIPTPWDISGSGTWRAKADNALCVWRDETQPGTMQVLVQKIRRRFVGKLGAVELNYDTVTGIISEWARKPKSTWPCAPVSREPGEDDE